jgi:hypothetical protein
MTSTPAPDMGQPVQDGVGSAPETGLDDFVAELLAKLNSTENLGEAGGGAWTDLGGIKTDKDGQKHVVRINLTSRARTPAAALRNLIEAIQMAEVEFALHPYPAQINATPTQAAAPANNVPAVPPSLPPRAATTPPVVPPPAGAIPAAPSNTRPAATVPPATTAPAVPPASTGEVQTFRITKMEVTPLAGGKATLKFYQDGDRYPRITNSRPVDQICKMLESTGGWQPAHFQVAQEYAVQFTLAWKNSTKMSQAGTPYKDIISIKPF